ncbi:MAG: hypothetical protein NVS2B4_09030 [Ramlibacter sp.]
MTGFLRKLFGGLGNAQARPRKRASRAVVSRAPLSSIPPANLRRELLRLALRQSLSRNGIPVHWIGAEVIELPGPGNPVHVRLLVQHWDERLPRLFLAFQEDFEQRLLAVEPLAHTWLRGFSWQFQLVDAAPHPRLPAADSWAPERERASNALVGLPLTAAPVVPALASGAGQSNERKIKDELERLFARQDAERAVAGRHPDFEPTREGDW